MGVSGQRHAPVSINTLYEISNVRLSVLDHVYVICHSNITQTSSSQDNYHACYLVTIQHNLQTNELTLAQYLTNIHAVVHIIRERMSVIVI
jgi:hypothetical protein